MATERLAALTIGSEPTESVTDLAATIGALGRELVIAESRVRSTQQTYDVVRAQRQSDERALNDLRESAVARALFHALEPVACPRCEAPVTKDRKAAERKDHTCSVCTTPVSVTDDDETRQQVDREASDRVTAGLEAERHAKADLAAASAEARARRDEVEDVEQRLQLAEQAAQAGERADLIDTIARLEGALSVLTPGEQAAEAPDEVERVLNAAAKLLEAASVLASQGLFDALNTEIVEARAGSACAT